VTFHGSKSSGPALSKRRASSGPALLAARYPLPATSAAAFTLVEVLIAMSLALMVMTAVLTVYVTLGRNFTRSLGLAAANQPNLETQGRRTLAWFAQDARMASGISGSPSNSTVILLQPSGTGTNEITYYYNGTKTAATVAIHGTNVSVPANSLVRALYNGTTVTSLTIQTNIVDPNDLLHANTTDYGCTFRYFDISGNPYDNGSSPYTTVTTYSSGIKQVSLTFFTQAGTSTNGTLSQVYETDSPRLLIRNKGLLP
jgi:Tfp pilus assembly protein PilW